MSTCGCFSPITQWLKNVFGRKEEEHNTGRIMEIGPPTNFRKEDITIPFIDDDQNTLHRNDSHGVMAEKEVAQNAALMRQASKRDQLRKQVLRLSARLTM